MILRTRIMTFYTATLAGALLIITAWSWFEFQEQREIVQIEGVPGAMRESPGVEALEIFLVGGLPALVVALVGGHFIMQHALRPITVLTEELEKTDVSNLTTPVCRSGNGDELDRMAAVFNNLKDRLGASFTQAREFTLHASHELKTPLTVLHSTLEQMLAQPEPGVALQQDRITSMLEEVQRLSGIVGQLAFLAKADAGQLAPTFGPVALHDMVRELVDDLVLLAQSAKITVTLEEAVECEVQGDRVRLRQLLMILGDNAVKHNVAGGTIAVRLRRDSAGACLQVTNTGPALPPELRTRVFERFFRGDPAHGSVAEGCGLGLSIAQSIVGSHHGRLEFSVLADGRTQLSLRLPLDGSLGKE